MYKFPVSRPKKVKLPKPKIDKPAKEEEAVGDTIQGKKVGSKEEWRIAQALNKADIQFEYQVPVGGGRSVRGGMVLDFLVMTRPMSTPLFVQGKYWHSGQHGKYDPYNMARVVRMLGGRSNMPKQVWDNEIPTQEAADTWVRRNLL